MIDDDTYAVPDDPIIPPADKVVDDLKDIATSSLLASPSTYLIVGLLVLVFPVAIIVMLGRWQQAKAAVSRLAGRRSSSSKNKGRYEMVEQRTV